MTHHQHHASAFISLLGALALPCGADAQGNRLGNEFQVNTYTSNHQRYPSVAADADGDFVIAWASNFQDGAGWGVFAHRFSSAGAPLATELQVNTYATSVQKAPSVVAETDGDFVVAWHSFGQDATSYGVFARRS